MSNHAVDIEILGKITRVNCPEGQEASLKSAAQDLDSRLKQMSDRSKVTNELQLLTIAALNAVYELRSKDKEASKEQQVLAQRIEKLTLLLDSSLSKTGHGQQK